MTVSGLVLLKHPIGSDIILAEIQFLRISYIASNYVFRISLFHRAFFNSIMDKTPTNALFTQHYISLAC